MDVRPKYPTLIDCGDSTSIRSISGLFWKQRRRLMVKLLSNQTTIKSTKGFHSLELRCRISFPWAYFVNLMACQVGPERMFLPHKEIAKLSSLLNSGGQTFRTIFRHGSHLFHMWFEKSVPTSKLTRPPQLWMWRAVSLFFQRIMDELNGPIVLTSKFTSASKLWVQDHDREILQAVGS